MKKLLLFAAVLITALGVYCSKAPVVDFPEPTDRVVLSEFISADF